MKKKLVMLSVLLLLASFVLAASSDYSSDYQATKNITDTVSSVIDPDSGTVNYDGFKSRAEVRIEAINAWFEEHQIWFKNIFRMVPEISWQFTFVLYFWLSFLAAALNATLLKILFGIWYLGKSEIDLNDRLLFEKVDEGFASFIPLSWAQLVGLVFFVILIATKVHVWLADLIYTIFLADNGTILNATRVIIIVALILAWIFIPKAGKRTLLFLRKKIRIRAEKTNSDELRVVDTLTKQIMRSRGM